MGGKTATSRPKKKTVSNQEVTKRSQNIRKKKEEEVVVIWIDEFLFKPPELCIEQQMFVRWLRMPTQRSCHAVTCANGQFESQTLTSDSCSFQRQFRDVGVFDYYCNIYSFMRGTIQVVSQLSPQQRDKLAPFLLSQQSNQCSVAVADEPIAVEHPKVLTKGNMESCNKQAIAPKQLKMQIKQWESERKSSNQVEQETEEESFVKDRAFLKKKSKAKLAKWERRKTTENGKIVQLPTSNQKKLVDTAVVEQKAIVGKPYDNRSASSDTLSPKENKRKNSLFPVPNIDSEEAEMSWSYPNPFPLWLLKFEWKEFAVHYVKIENFEFSPQNLSISLGDVVVWEVTKHNGNKMLEHCIRIKNSKVNSHALGAGDKFAWRFNGDEPMNISYECSVYRMEGTLSVLSKNIRPSRRIKKQKRKKKVPSTPANTICINKQRGSKKYTETWQRKDSELNRTIINSHINGEVESGCRKPSLHKEDQYRRINKGSNKSFDAKKAEVFLSERWEKINRTNEMVYIKCPLVKRNPYGLSLTSLISGSA